MGIRMKFGVQLFGVLNGSKRQPEEIFRAIHEAGAVMVEPCIATGRIEGYEDVIWSVEYFEKMAPLLKENGLEVSSCHIFRPDEHLPNMEVEIWRMDADGGNKARLAVFFGGQGSMNVNSWAKDSRHIAFVSYELKHK